MLLCFHSKTPTKGGKSTGTQVQFDILEQIEKAIESLTYPITGSPSHGKLVSGIICLHVDDLFCVGDNIFYHHVVSAIQKDYQIGSEDTNDVIFLVKEYVGKPRTTSHLYKLTKKEASNSLEKLI